MYSPQQNTLQNFQLQSMRLISGILEHHSLASYIYDKRDKLTCFQTTNVNPGMHREYTDTFHYYDPLHVKNFNQPEVKIIQSNDLVPAERRASNEYYRRFLASWRIKNTVELRVVRDSRVMAGFTLFVDKHERDFTSAELKKLEHLHDMIQFSFDQVMSNPLQVNFESFCSEHRLTPKEIMVLEQLLQGLPNKTISDRLCCKVSTIKTHLQNIFSKLGANSKAEVIASFHQY